MTPWRRSRKRAPRLSPTQRSGDHKLGVAVLSTRPQVDQARHRKRKTRDRDIDVQGFATLLFLLRTMPLLLLLLLVAILLLLSFFRRTVSKATWIESACVV